MTREAWDASAELEAMGEDAAREYTKRYGLALFILWALPRGKTDRLDEWPLTSMAITRAQAERVQAAASADGWHGFRLVEDGAPDFGNVFNK